MTDPAAIHSTFVIERSYPQPPARVFAAFAQPSRKRRWYAEGDHEIQEFEMDFRVGGTERFSYRFKEGHPIGGSEIANETVYQEILPDQRIIVTSKMALNGKPIQIVLATIEFLPSENGTNLHFTHQGTYIDWPDGAAMLEKGWRNLFERLNTELSS
jgi:uncharacterized protein YndB with AHSA1/START domain